MERNDLKFPKIPLQQSMTAKLFRLLPSEESLTFRRQPTNPSFFHEVCDHDDNTAVLFSKKLDVLTKPTYPSFFHEVCDHDDDAAVLFPHHSPEISKCLRQWTLGGNVCLWLLVTLSTFTGTQSQPKCLLHLGYW